MAESQLKISIMLIDFAIEAAGDHLKGQLVSERIKEKLANLDMNSQFPANCSFKQAGAPAKAWRAATTVGEDVDEDNEEGHNKKRIKLERYPCKCSKRSAKKGILLFLNL